MESLDEVIEYIDPQSFSSDPKKARSISKFFKQKEFNTQVVRALSVIANELLNRDNKASANFDILFSNQHDQRLNLNHIEKAIRESDQKIKAVSSSLHEQNLKLGELNDAFFETNERIGAISSNLRAQDLRLEQLREELVSKEDRIYKMLRELDHNTKKLEENDRKAQLFSKSSKDQIEKLKNQSEKTYSEIVALDKRYEAHINNVEKKVDSNVKTAKEKFEETDSAQRKHESLLNEIAKQISETEIQHKSTAQKLTLLENKLAQQNENVQKIENWQTQSQKATSLLETRIYDQCQKLQSDFNATYALVKSSYIEKETTLSSIKLNINQLHQELKNFNNTHTKASQPLLNTEDYLAFENIYRGSEEAIKQRLSFYKEPIDKCMKEFDPNNCLIADLGCGRGEWLDILKDWKYKNTIGVDLSDSMIQQCSNSGHQTFHADLFDYLEDQKPSSHDLITAFHVVEHLTYFQLNRLSKELLRVLKPGACFLFETPNSANVIVGSSTFFLDPTHQRPLPPELAKFFFERRGFDVKNTFYLNGLGLDFDLGKSRKRTEIRKFFDRWFGIGLDYSILIQKPK